MKDCLKSCICKVFPRFVNTEGRLESITALSNPNWAQYHVHYVLLLVYYSLKISYKNHGRPRLS